MIDLISKFFKWF